MTVLECEVIPSYEELLETERLQGETIRLQAASLAEQDRQIAELKRQIEDLQRQVFGRRSEKLKRQEKEDAEKPEENETAKAPPRKAKKDSAAHHQGGGRGAFPQDLEVIRIVLDVPESEKFCQETGEPLVFLRNEVTRKLKFIPGRWVCHEYVRPMYGRRRDLMAGVMNPVMASLPKQLIPGSDIENGFLAHLIVSKYLDYQPWYRQEQIARRAGVELSRRKLCRWSAEVANLVAPIYLFLGAMIAKSLSWMADETFVNVLDPERPGKARKAWLWVYLSLEAKVAVFDFNPSRNQDSPLKFFPPGAKGDLLTDGYSVYPAVLAKRPGLVHACCWSHARRGWEKALQGGGQIVRDILLGIQKLFAIDKEARKAGMSATQRETLRREKGVQAILDDLHKQMTAAKESTLPQSRTHKAANYALDRWKELGVFAQPGKGHVELSTNTLENKIRSVALGRKNCLFIGHPKAGKKSAIFYSIFATCKLCEVCPEKYLHWLFPKLAGATNQMYATLLPHAYAAELKAAADKAEPDG
jgi:transposase